MKRIFLVFLLALVLRTAFISKFPIGFNPDEASFGYDAYSIIKTGADQWGVKFPIVLQSFGDYKAPLYTYLAIPTVYIFGLSPFSVRLPNAIVGTFAVVAFYFMIRQIFEFESNNKNFWWTTNNSNKRDFISFWSALLFAISPWHIAMSRGAFEANLTTFFIPLGIYLFIQFINSKKAYFLYLSAVTFGLNLFSYHSAKLITAIIIAVLVVLFAKEIKTQKTVAFKASIILSFFVAVTFYTFVLGAGARLADVSIFKLSLNNAAAERIRAFNNGLPDVVARGFHNKYQVFVKTAASNYLSYISPQFLFTRGAGEKTYGMTDDRGVLYWFELPFLLIFIYWLVRNKPTKTTLLIAIWFLVSPIPASLAIGPGFAANRAVVMLPSVYLFLGIGVYELFHNDFVAGKMKSKGSIIKYGYLAVSLVFVISFIENYFFVAPSKIAKDMLYGNLAALQYVSSIQNRSVVVSRRLSEPHIYVAFAKKMDPNIYQKAAEDWDYKEQGFGWVDQLGEYRLDNYLFKNIHYQEWVDKGVILVGKPEEFPENVIPVKKFATPSGEDLIYVVDTTSSYYAKEIKN